MSGIHVSTCLTVKYYIIMDTSFYFYILQFICMSSVHLQDLQVFLHVFWHFSGSVRKEKPSIVAKTNKSKSSCCVPQCTVAGYVVEELEKITFHKLPIEDKKRLKQWIHNIRREPGPNFNISKHTKICSRHFLPTDFITGATRRQLKVTAIPTRFPFMTAKVERRHVLRPDVPSASKANEDTSPQLNSERNETSEEKILRLEAELNLQKEAAALFQRERDHMKDIVRRATTPKCHFSINDIKSNPKQMAFYTGFSSHEEFQLCFMLLDVGENCKNMIYIDNQHNVSRSTRSKKLTPEDEFFITMVRLRVGLFVQDMSLRFGISSSSITRIFLSWINYIYLKLGNLQILPSHEEVHHYMPDSMRQKYPNTEWIIDAFEIQSERPSSLVLQSKSYSTYKSRNTLKGLLACTPSGQIGFISQLYTGNISDRELTIRSGFLKIPHTRGAMWLADRGFLIQDLAEPLGVTVNIPAFKQDATKKLSAAGTHHTQQIASERIHVERAINKVKNFHIFDKAIPLSSYGSVNQVWTVCALLTLFQNPIISA